MSVNSLKFLIEYQNNIKKDQDFLKKYVNKKFLDILKEAYNNVSYYNKEYKNIYSKVNDINDIKSLPFISKEIIRKISYNDIINNKYNKNELLARQTSGSTGIPLTVYASKNSSMIDSAVWQRSFDRRGIRLSDRIVTLKTPRDFPKNKKLFEKIGEKIGIINRSYISIFEEPKIQLKKIEDYKPDVIKGYPSVLSILADELKNKTYNINPKMILTSAELLDASTRKKISKVFGTEIYDNYSSEEWGLIAWECKEHMGYHINLDNIYLELVDKKGEVVDLNEMGEIVCTTLSNDAMPLIRYKMKDYALMLEDKCSCGINLPLFKVIEGRYDDFLIDNNGNFVSPRLVSDILEEPFNNYTGINQYQIIQENPNKLIINLETNSQYIDDINIYAKSENLLKNILGNNLEVNFRTVDRIESDKTGKLRKIISKVPR